MRLDLVSYSAVLRGDYSNRNGPAAAATLPLNWVTHTDSKTYDYRKQSTKCHARITWRSVFLSTFVRFTSSRLSKNAQPQAAAAPIPRRMDLTSAGRGVFLLIYDPNGRCEVEGKKGKQVLWKRR